jgi:hypothetical protein
VVEDSVEFWLEKTGLVGDSSSESGFTFKYEDGATDCGNVGNAGSDASCGNVGNTGSDVISGKGVTGDGCLPQVSILPKLTNCKILYVCNKGPRKHCLKCCEEIRANMYPT